MGYIPPFTRTVLPQTANPQAVSLARAQGDINAQNTLTAGRQAAQIGQTMADYAFREGQARNATFVNEAVIQAKREAIEGLDIQRQARMGNPDGFHKDFDKDLLKSHESMVKAAPSEEARTALRQSLDGLRLSTYEDNFGWERTRKLDMMAESLQRAGDNLDVLALRAGQKGEDVDDLLRNAQATAVAGSTLLAPEKAESLNRTMQQNVLGNYLEGMSENDPQGAKEILKSGKYDDVLGADEIQRLDGVADTEIKRRKAEAQLDMKDDVDNFNAAAKMGLKIDHKTADGLIARMTAAGDKEGAKDISDYMAIQDKVSVFAVAPTTEQNQVMINLKQAVEGGDLSSAPLLQAYQNSAEAKAAAVKSGNEMAYYAAHGVVRAPQPIDFSNPAMVAGELDQRRIAAHQISKIDGTVPSLLTPPEIESLSEKIKTSEPRMIGSIIGELAESISDDEVRAIAQQIAPKEPVIAAALALDDSALASSIISGASIKATLTPAEFGQAVNVKIGGVIPDPERADIATQAIFARYKSIQYSQGADSDEVDEKIMDRAITDVLGPVVEIDTHTGIGGKHTVLSYKDNLTKQWVEDWKLEDILYSLDDEKLELLGQDPLGAWNAAELLSSAEIRSSGDGRYAFTDGAGDLVYNKNGTVLEIDARALEKLGKK